MNDETIVRLGTFVSLFVIFALWELGDPRRRQTARRSIRWFGNLSLATINSFATHLLIPILAVGMAALAAENQWGLFNLANLPKEIELVLAVVILDLVIYLQHILFHSIPVLWRLHRVHHSDVDLDVTSAVRFHVIEIMISMGIKFAAIIVIGPSVLAVLLFEVILNGTAIFNHANIRLPNRIDAFLRIFLVTPDMHRVHHSVIPSETNSNYGFNLSIWDRLFNTYRRQPSAGHETMIIGVEEFRNERDQRLDRLLAQPFKSQSVNRNRRDESSDTDPATDRDALWKAR